MILVRFTQYSTDPIKNIVGYEVGTVLEGSMEDPTVHVKYAELTTYIATQDLEEVDNNGTFGRC